MDFQHFATIWEISESRRLNQNQLAATRQNSSFLLWGREHSCLIFTDQVPELPESSLLLSLPTGDLILPSVFPSIKIFSNELTLCSRWPKYQSFSISASNEYSRLVSFRIDWFDFLAVQWTLKSLLEFHIYEDLLLFLPNSLCLIFYDYLL